SNRGGATSPYNKQFSSWSRSRGGRQEVDGRRTWKGAAFPHCGRQSCGRSRVNRRYAMTTHRTVRRPGSNRPKMARREEAIGMRTKSGDESPHSKKATSPIVSHLLRDERVSHARTHGLGRLFQAGAVGNILGESSQDRPALFTNGSRQEHPVGFKTAQLSRREI